MTASSGLRPSRRATTRNRGLLPLLRFAVAGALGDSAGTGRALRAARAARVPRREIEETGLMLVLYAGYPAALEALRATQQMWPARVRRSWEGGPARWRRRGTALCARVYGPVYPRVRDTVRALHPDLDAWMVETGYGRVLSRPGLSVRRRELVSVAVLAATRRERQLVSHLLGAARVGAPVAAMRLAVAAGASGRTGRATARRAWRGAFGRVDPARTAP